MKEKLTIFSLVFGILALVSGFCFSPFAQAAINHEIFHNTEAEDFSIDHKHETQETDSMMPCCQEKNTTHSKSFVFNKNENQGNISALLFTEKADRNLYIEKLSRFSFLNFFAPPGEKKIASVVKIE